MRPNRKLDADMEEFPPLRRCDVSLLSVGKNASVFMFDGVTAGIPLLQGLASCLPVILVWVAPSLPAKSCKKRSICYM